MIPPHAERGFKILAWLLAMSFGLSSLANAQQAVRSARDGSLRYQQDELGNRIPDFSHCGYEGGNSDIPTIPAKVFVAPGEGDDGSRIQAAIDYVADLPIGCRIARLGRRRWRFDNLRHRLGPPTDYSHRGKE
jgi:hypothetical protein